MGGRKEEGRMFQRFKGTGAGCDFLVVGLGNPGRNYEETRHNVGFMTVDRLAAARGLTLKRARFQGVTGEGVSEGKKLLLLKPGTYMNLSGRSVVAAMQFYKLKPEQVLLIFDDISLPVGSIRIRRKGSHGGHNGVKSIIALSGEEGFPRIKIGVGGKPHPEDDLADWVLSRFTGQEKPDLERALTHAQEAAGLIVGDRLDEAMQMFNGR